MPGQILSFLQEQRASLSYHIGVRSSMDAPETVMILYDSNPEFTLAMKVLYDTYMLTVTKKELNDMITIGRLLSSHS